MNILIAEDELPAQDELTFLLSDLEPDAAFFKAGDGEAALKIIEREPIDLVFLDIHMPGMDGLTAASLIMQKPDPPLVVFATAFDEHALKAFELATMDYVVKPFDERRLEKTMNRAREALLEKKALDTRRETTRQFLQNTPSINRIWAQMPSKDWVLVDYIKILYFVAEEGKVFIQTTSEDHLLVHQTLKDLEPRLTPHQFIRVHKAFLVNLSHVAEVAPLFSGTFVIRLDDPSKTKVPLARSFVTQFKKLTGWSE
jgi:DNA-binding LytR/AlgR family response regulator